jgi:hypothetical protein
MFAKTGAAARQIGINALLLQSLIRANRIPRPAKDTSGQYIWTPEDIARAKAALRVDRRLKKFRQKAAVGEGGPRAA